MEPPVVKEIVAGTCVIDINVFRRKLGLTAFEVWVSFLWRRNRDGYSFASARSISRFKNLPYTSVRRAVAKLADLNIISDARWVKNEHGLKRFRRRIRGDYRNGIVLIPAEIEKDILAKKSWGGAREGAGRPCNSAPPDIRDSTYIQVDTTSEEEGVSTYIQDDTTSIQVGRTLISMFKKEDNYIPYGDIMREKIAPSFSSFSSSFDEYDETHDEEAPPVLPESSVVEDHTLATPNHEGHEKSPSEEILEANPDLCSIHNQDKEDSIMTPKEDISSSPYIQVGQGSNPIIEKTMPMPPFPSTSLIKVPKIPPPPKLPSTLSDEQCVKKLAEAYRGAYESRYGKRCYVMTRGSIKKNKFYKSLVVSANFMRDNDIPPASWAAFSLDCWISFGEKNEGANKKPPPVNWVFSMKRLEERAGWFDREAASYGGGRLLFTQKHKELLRKYEGLRRAAYRELLTEKLIERFFPGGWEKHYDEAEKESAKDSARLLALVKRGDFIW